MRRGQGGGSSENACRLAADVYPTILAVTAGVSVNDRVNKEAVAAARKRALKLINYGGTA